MASAAHFRVEHVAETPRGWRVRSSKHGKHVVRIAFPPGRRRKGAGKPVEILHPQDEKNPSCILSNKARTNPAELLIFGNPSFREVLKSGTREVVIWKDAEGSKYHVSPYVNSGETILKSLGKFAQLETARAKANAWLERGRNGGKLEQQRAARERADRIRGARLNPRQLTVPEKHQLKIARDTLKIPDAMAGVMGGPTKAQAREIIRRLTGKSNPRPFAGWKHFTKKEKNFLRSIHMPAPRSEEDVRAYKESLKKIDEINRQHRGNPWVGAGNYKTREEAEKLKRQLEAAGKRVTIVVSAKGTSAENYGVAVMNPRQKNQPFLCHRCGKEFTAAQVEAGEHRKHIAEHRAKDQPKNRKRRNPDELQQAVQLYQSFHGRDPKNIVDAHVSAAVRMEYTALGDLEYLKVLTPLGQQVQFNFDGDRVKLASSPDGKQLYIIGGNQDLRSCLDKDSLEKDFIDLGEAQEVQYLARKVHGQFRPVSYYHKFGEVNGAKPQLMFDKLKKQIFFVGGEYRIDTSKGVSPGIEN